MASFSARLDRSEYSRSPGTAAATAAATPGAGGYGFSLALSLTRSSIFSCSPGTYGSSAASVLVK